MWKLKSTWSGREAVRVSVGSLLCVQETTKLAYEPGAQGGKG